MTLKIEFIFTILACYSAGIYAEDNLSCHQVDFNKTESYNEFEACLEHSPLVLKSYEDAPFPPYRDDAKYYLSNDQVGNSCFTTIEMFDLDEYTEFYLAIYFNSGVIDDSSYFEVQLYIDSTITLVKSIPISLSNEWIEIHEYFDGTAENAKVRYTKLTILLVVSRTICPQIIILLLALGNNRSRCVQIQFNYYQSQVIKLLTGQLVTNYF